MRFFKRSKEKIGFEGLSAENIQKQAAISLVIEIIIIAIFAVGVLMALNYLGIFSLSKISPTLFGWLPVKNHEADKKNLIAPDEPAYVELPSDEENFEKIYALASKKRVDEERGYAIIWKDPNEIEGRTILYDNNSNTTAPRLLAGRLNGVGKINGEDGEIRYTAGIFEEIVEGDSESKAYIVVKNPLTKEVYPKIEVDLSSTGTRVYVEDVDYGPKKPIPDYVAEAEQYGLLNQIIDKSSLLKKGDAIIVLPDPTFDGNQSEVGSSIILRRYGGKLAFK